jgi:ArsR family transcriptional regulator
MLDIFLYSGKLCLFDHISEPAVNKTQRALYEARARIIKAMAHPTRLFIVDVLSRGERCVCDLTEMIGADVSTVSKHLSVLRDTGIIQGEKRGAQVYYTLRVPCVLNFFSCVESVIKTTAEDNLKLTR